MSPPVHGDRIGARVFGAILGAGQPAEIRDHGRGHGAGRPPPAAGNRCPRRHHRKGPCGDPSGWRPEADGQGAAQHLPGLLSGYPDAVRGGTGFWKDHARSKSYTEQDRAGKIPCPRGGRRARGRVLGRRCRCEKAQAPSRARSADGRAVRRTPAPDRAAARGRPLGGDPARDAGASRSRGPAAGPPPEPRSGLITPGAPAYSPGILVPGPPGRFHCARR